MSNSKLNRKKVSVLIVKERKTHQKEEQPENLTNHVEI